MVADRPWRWLSLGVREDSELRGLGSGRYSQIVVLIFPQQM